MLVCGISKTTIGRDISDGVVRHEDIYPASRAIWDLRVGGDRACDRCDMGVNVPWMDRDCCAILVGYI